MLHPGDCLNPLSFFGNGYVDVTAEALEPTILIRLKHETVLRILVDDSELQPRIIHAGTERMRTVIDRLINMMTETAESRVYKLLVTLTSRYQDTIPFTHHELADMLGVTRETVTRAISNLSGVGITHSTRGCVKILNIEALKTIATSGAL
jgi:CRP/FNR family transcriptional regulator, cyclic AMP receptor protein